MCTHNGEVYLKSEKGSVGFSSVFRYQVRLNTVFIVFIYILIYQSNITPLKEGKKSLYFFLILFYVFLVL